MPACSEYKSWVGQVHDYMYFTVNIGIRPLVCYVTDGVSQYNNWFMAERKLISVTAYDVRLILSEVSREPVVHFRIDDVAFKSPYRYYVSIPNSFDPSVVRRIINVVEKINQVPYHFADVVTVDSSGYSLRVTKVNPRARDRRTGAVTGYVHFDASGKITSSAFDLPITLFAQSLSSLSDLHHQSSFKSSRHSSSLIHSSMLPAFPCFVPLTPHHLRF